MWLESAEGVLPAGFQLLLNRNAGQISISFTALGPDALGRSRYHTLERCTNLLGGPWLPLPGCSNVLGSNQTITCSDTNQANGAVFYRSRVEIRNP